MPHAPVLRTPPPPASPVALRRAGRRTGVALTWWVWVAWLWALAMLGWTPGARAQDLQPVPALNARVMDEVGLLSPDARAALEQKLAGFEAQAGPQIVLLLVASTQPEDIASYAQRVGETWKIGRREVGDGLLMVVARDDRKLWIAPAKALEGAVPDLAARQIVRDTISPAFKQGDYAGGLNAGVDQLMARIRGEGLPEPAANGDRRGGAGSGLGLEQVAMFFFVGVPVLGALLTGMFGRKLGSLVTGGAAGTAGWWLSSSLLVGGAAGVLALLLVGVMGIGAAGRRSGGLGRGGPPVIFGGGGGGGWGGGGGGGGFSSGGGGDFGGGGAGGDW